MASDRAAMVVKISANLEPLRQQLQQSGVLIESTTKRLQGMAASLSGDQLIKRASEITASLKAMGGATTQTAAEAAKLEVTLSKAINKLTVMGKAVPPDLLQMRDALKKVSTEGETLTQWFGRMATSARGLLGAMGIGVGVGGAVSFVKGAFAHAGEIADLSAKLGVSAEAIQRWSFAAKQSGATMDQVGASVAQMSNRLVDASDGVRAALQTIGLNLDTLRGKRPEDAFNAIVRAIGAMDDPMAAVNVTMELFGKQGLEILPAIRNQFDELAKSATVSSDAQIQAMDAASDALDQFIEDAKARATSFLGNAVIGAQALMGNPTNLLNSILGELPSSARDVLGTIGVIDAPKRNTPMATAAEQIKNVERATKDAGEAAKRAKKEYEEWLKTVARLNTEMARSVNLFTAGFLGNGNPNMLTPPSGGFVTGAGDTNALFGQLREQFNYHPNLLGKPPTQARDWSSMLQAGRALVGVIGSVGTQFGRAGQIAMQFGQIGLDALSQVAQKASVTATLMSAAFSGIAAGATLFIQGIVAAYQRAAQYTREYQQELASLNDQIEELNGQTATSIKLAKQQLEFLQMGATGEASWEQIQEAAEKYGLSLDALGQKFQQMKANSMFDQLHIDWKNFADIGADVNAVMAAMAPQVNAMLQQAQQFGLKVPEYLKPMLQAMSTAGLVSIEGVQFDPTIQSILESQRDLLLRIATGIDRMAPPDMDLDRRFAQLWPMFGLGPDGLNPSPKHMGASQAGPITIVSPIYMDNREIARGVVEVARELGYG